MAGVSDVPERGVDFPLLDGTVSTTATGREVLTAALRGGAPAGAEEIATVSDWRSGYLGPFRSLVEAGAASTEAARRVAADGLAALHERFVFVRGGESLTLTDAMAVFGAPAFDTVEVDGSGERETELTVPYRGRRLHGSDVRRQLDRWVADDVVEPSFRDAVGNVLDNPGWLDLRDTTVVVIGAGAEMGPLRSLSRWGARILAVDLPRPELWARVITTARAGAGTVCVPVRRALLRGRRSRPDDTQVAVMAGADLIHDLPELRTWVASFDGPLVLGNYAYADGATHVRVSMAADTLALDLLGTRPAGDVTLAYLATPTDVFTVPPADVARAREKWHGRRTRRLWQTPLQAARLYEPNYRTTVVDDTGREVGIADILVPQQGPNYALAKRLQRWRAVAAHEHGVPVSLNVAPATRTRSVVKNRALAAAYAGAHRFGIEVFDPSTSNTLMAALLVRDLRDPTSAARPGSALANPLDLFWDAANHGGLWRSAYAPRSVLGVAAVLGMFERNA